MSFKESFRDKWNALTPKARRTITIAAVMIFMGSIIYLGWQKARGKQQEKAQKREPQEQSLSLDETTLSKSKEADYQLRMAQQEKRIEALKSGKPVPEDLAALDPRAESNFVSPIVAKGDNGENNNLDKMTGKPREEEFSKKEAVASMLAPGNKQNTGKKASGNPDSVLPPLPPPVPNTASMRGGGAFKTDQNPNQFPSIPPAPQPDQELGDIMSVSAPVAETKSAGSGKKKEKLTVYLPPSFMAATLLSGLDAPTAGSAKGNPVPVLIRVKLPAVLPNEVKAQLAGCFVIADGKGNLSSERADLTLVSISCLDRKGGAVIDQRIKGFVVDADGKIGLRGRVVAKFGATVARTTLAGFLVGAGNALKTSTQTTSVSPLGTTTLIDPKQVGLAAAGGALSDGFQEIQKFYMELARESLPVIEVGAAKRVTLVVSEGVNLEVKPLKGWGGI